jgi:hypothetical protein
MSCSLSASSPWRRSAVIYVGYVVSHAALHVVAQLGYLALQTLDLVPGPPYFAALVAQFGYLATQPLNIVLRPSY